MLFRLSCILAAVLIAGVGYQFTVWYFGKSYKKHLEKHKRNLELELAEEKEAIQDGKTE